MIRFTIFTAVAFVASVVTAAECYVNDAGVVICPVTAEAPVAASGGSYGSTAHAVVAVHAAPVHYASGGSRGESRRDARRSRRAARRAARGGSHGSTAHATHHASGGWVYVAHAPVAMSGGSHGN